MKTTNSPCPVCDHELLDPPQMSFKTLNTRYRCPRCGNFEMDTRDPFDANFKNIRHLLSAWIRRQMDAGVVLVNLSSVFSPSGADFYSSLLTMGFPLTVSDKLNTLLTTLARMIGDRVQVSLNLKEDPALIARIAAKDESALFGLSHLLQEQGFLDFPTAEEVRITAIGWLRAEELSRVPSIKDSAFLAMWFDECTECYRKATEAAMLYCGYEPIVVDQEEFNDFIMNQVISLIRQSRFIVADFTSRPECIDGEAVKCGVRGGVYWESGMAYGLDKPVIHTCESSAEAKRRIHFDVDQYQTIFWHDDELATDIRTDELEKGSMVDPRYAERLASRILATIGKGSYRV